MCSRLVDDVVMQFGDGDTLGGTEPVPVPFAELHADDEIEIQVLSSTASDGDVAVYKSHATSAKASLLRARVNSLTNENPCVPVRFLARSTQLAALCSNPSGIVTVIFRQYRAAKGGCS